MSTRDAILLLAAGAMTTVACSPPPGQSGSLLSSLDPAPAGVSLDQGTQIEGVLASPLSSLASRTGERFEVITTTALHVGDRSILPAGSRVGGMVAEAVPAAPDGGEALLNLRFMEMSVPGGDVQPILAELSGLAESDTLSAAVRPAARRPSPEGTSRELSGRLIGGPRGASLVIGSDGRQVLLPRGTRMTIRLLEPVDIGGQR